jgi:hypothetical protein
MVLSPDKTEGSGYKPEPAGKEVVPFRTKFLTDFYIPFC